MFVYFLTLYFLHSMKNQVETIKIGKPLLCNVATINVTYIVRRKLHRKLRLSCEYVPHEVIETSVRYLVDS